MRVKYAFTPVLPCCTLPTVNALTKIVTKVTLISPLIVRFHDANPPRERPLLPFEPIRSAHFFPLIPTDVMHARAASDCWWKQGAVER